MRDFSDTDAAKPISEPRGRAALGLSRNGMFHDWVITPMKGRAVTIAAKATSIALTVFTGVVLVVAVYTLLS